MAPVVDAGGRTCDEASCAVVVCVSFGFRHANNSAPFSREIIGEVLSRSAGEFLLSASDFPFRLEALVLAAFDVAGGVDFLSFRPGDERALEAAPTVAFFVDFGPLVGVLALPFVAPRARVSFRALSFLPRVIVALTRRSKT